MEQIRLKLYALISLAHKSKFAGHVIVTTGLRRMHFLHPDIFPKWNSNLQQVDFSQGFALNDILTLVVLAVNDGFLHLHTCVISHIFLYFSVYIFAIWKFKYDNHLFLEVSKLKVSQFSKYKQK